MEAVERVYDGLAEELKIAPIRHGLPLKRRLPNAAYRELWQERIDQGHPVSRWIELPHELPAGVRAPFGVGLVPSAGRVELVRLLDAWRGERQTEGHWKDRTWSTAQGCPEGYEGVIDCRGVGAVADLAARGLIVNPNHGEVLTLKNAGGPTDGIWSVGKWLMPVGDGRALLGATYRWDFEEPVVLSETERELIEAVEPTLEGDIGEITAHRAGLRPASPDRRPLAGWVNREAGWATLNGLGSRGVLHGPWVADALVRHLLAGIPLPEDVDLKRVKSYLHP
jgi:glycine/D-amino acid oxidase-like deaminating enzyme